MMTRKNLKILANLQITIKLLPDEAFIETHLCAVRGAFAVRPFLLLTNHIGDRPKCIDPCNGGRDFSIHFVQIRR